jgi:hypothetical protein
MEAFAVTFGGVNVMWVSSANMSRMPINVGCKMILRLRSFE